MRQVQVYDVQVVRCLDGESASKVQRMDLGALTNWSQLNRAGMPSLAWIALASWDPMPRAEASVARYCASGSLSRSMPMTEAA